MYDLSLKQGSFTSSASKELSWFEKLNLRLDAFIDVDHAVAAPSDFVQQTSQYVESSVTSVGSNVKKICGDFMKDLFLVPPFSLERSEDVMESKAKDKKCREIFPEGETGGSICLSDSITSTESIMKQAEAQRDPEQHLLTYRPGKSLHSPKTWTSPDGKKLRKERQLNAVRLSQQKPIDSEQNKENSSKQVSPESSLKIIQSTAFQKECELVQQETVPRPSEFPGINSLLKISPSVQEDTNTDPALKFSDKDTAGQLNSNSLVIPNKVQEEEKLDVSNTVLQAEAPHKLEEIAKKPEASETKFRRSLPGSDAGQSLVVKKTSEESSVVSSNCGEGQVFMKEEKEGRDPSVAHLTVEKEEAMVCGGSNEDVLDVTAFNGESEVEVEEEIAAVEAVMAVEVGSESEEEIPEIPSDIEVKITPIRTGVTTYFQISENQGASLFQGAEEQEGQAWWYVPSENILEWSYGGQEAPEQDDGGEWEWELL